MLSQSDNELMCRVEGAAPMGAVLRSFWLPALLTEEVPQSGDGPKAFRLLGERLIAWRTGTGEIVILPEACPHRAASLTLARDEGDGLRCIYHGWKMNKSGVVVETPAEPTARICGKVSMRKYACHEAGGIVWAYLGTGEPPLRPKFRWMEAPSSHYSVRKAIAHGNFIQVMEGTLDSSHSDYLHSTQTLVSSIHNKSTVGRQGTRTRPSADRSPLLEVHDTEFGFVYVALRKALDDPENLYYARATAYAMPVYTFVPPNNALAFGPIDDEHTAMYQVIFDLEQPLDAEIIKSQDVFNGTRMGADINADYTRVINASNHWLQDRSAMRGGSSYTGIQGTICQDVAVTESMGPIQDRTLEHLGQGDRALARMRKILLDRAKQARDGKLEVPEANLDLRQVRSAAGIISQRDDWWQALYERKSMTGSATAAHLEAGTDAAGAS